MSSETRHQRAAFLGIEHSLTGRRWAERLGDERIALAMAQRHGLPDAICRLLAAREVDLEGVPDFLEPTLRKFLPDPSHLKDMDLAVARLVRAVQQGERIVVFGDYDVDGATSSALLLRFFRAIGGNIGVYIPDRRKEGYGPNAPALLKLREEGASVVVTVDCGVTAYEPLAEARKAGLDVVVIDHHQAELALPEALAVVDPNRIDDQSPHKQLAAVGVAFLLCVGINRALRAAGWYGDARPEPDLRQWLDLVALGTVADVVPLTGVNRALVRQGLAVMQQRRNPGLAALADVGAPARAAGRLSSRLHAGAARQCRRPCRPGRSRRPPAGERRCARGRRARHPPRRVQRRAPRHRARGARPGDRPHRGPVRARPQGPAGGAGGRERGLAYRRDRHRR